MGIKWWQILMKTDCWILGNTIDLKTLAQVFKGNKTTITLNGLIGRKAIIRMNYQAQENQNNEGYPQKYFWGFIGNRKVKKRQNNGSFSRYYS